MHRARSSGSIRRESGPHLSKKTNERVIVGIGVTSVVVAVRAARFGPERSQGNSED